MGSPRGRRRQLPPRFQRDTGVAYTHGSGVLGRHATGRPGYRHRWPTARIERLEVLLRARGVSPTAAGDLAEEYRLLANARESALAALRIYNDPVAGYRTEAFIVLMVGAWNSLLQAMLERSGTGYYERDEHGA